MHLDVRRGDDPPQNRGLAHPGGAGDHQGLPIQCRPIQPGHDLGQRGGPALEAMATLGSHRDPPGPGIPVPVGLPVPRQRPTPRRLRDIVASGDLPLGQQPDPLGRQVPVGLMQRDRPAVPPVVGLPHDTDHGAVVRAPQPSAAEARFHVVARVSVQSHPAVAERRAHRAVGRAPPRIAVREPERPPRQPDHITGLRAPQRRRRHPRRDRIPKLHDGQVGHRMLGKPHRVRRPPSRGRVLTHRERHPHLSPHRTEARHDMSRGQNAMVINDDGCPHGLVVIAGRVDCSDP